jgi:hypothetical protein
MTQPAAKPITLDLPTFRPRPPQTPAVPAATSASTVAPPPTAPPAPAQRQPSVAATMAKTQIGPWPKTDPTEPSPVAQPTHDPATHLPNLPKGRRPHLTNHRNDANATRAMDLLDQVDNTLSQWHQDLRQVLDQIQAVYLAGPIIEGWLEAIAPENDASRAAQPHASLLRHGDPAHLATYVEHLTQSAAPPSPHGGVTQYRLCSLDADGRVQCQLCPPDQLGAISQGIARHQQLRTLVQHKQGLEARLQKAATVLTTVCDQLDILPPANP